MRARAYSLSTKSNGSRCSTSKQTRPAERAEVCGVTSRTPLTSASPALSRCARVCVRAAMRARPILRAKLNASASAQRCSKEWKPPGVMAAARGRPGIPLGGGSVPSSQGPERAAVEGGNRGSQRAPGVGSAPDHAGATWAEQPLVAAGDEEVAPELFRCRGLDPEAVHPVNAEENARRAERVRDGADRQLDAGARVHPRERQDLRLGRDASPHRGHDLVDGSRARVLVEADLAHVRSGSQRTEPERF